MAAWVASVLCLYVAGLSCLAKVESEPGLVRFWPCLLLGAPVLLAMFGESGWRGSQRCAAGQRNFGAVGVALFAAYVLGGETEYWENSCRLVGGDCAGGFVGGTACGSGGGGGVFRIVPGCSCTALGAGDIKPERFPFPVVIQCVRLRVEVRPLKVSSATPDLSSSPKPSSFIFSYCFQVDLASGSFRPSPSATSGRCRYPWRRDRR